MRAESPKLRSLDLLDSKLRTLHLGITLNLEILRVRMLVKITRPHNNAKVDDPLPSITLNLKTVSLKGCHAWVKLHILAECLKLVTLNLTYCKLVAELPEDIGRLECLKELDMT
ncbi:Toll/interleukin-1 receptor domain-containing protein [Tanacetum coccineum]